MKHCGDFPDIQTIAEEATDWPGISKPTFASGLGFGMKWMMGWMHDAWIILRRTRS
jgi:1,4-alpha-glucan branching enzyme